MVRSLFGVVSPLYMKWQWLRTCKQQTHGVVSKASNPSYPYPARQTTTKCACGML